MRVAILSPYPTFPFQQELGCPAVPWLNNATWTVALGRHLAKMPDTEVHVVTESTDIACSKTIQVDGVNLHFLKAPRKYKTLTLWYFDRRRLHHALAEIQPDIVHGQGIETQYGSAAVTSHWPHLLTIHGIPKLSNDARRLGPFARDRFVERLVQRVMDKARNIVVINPFVAEYLRLEDQHYRLFSIPNAVGHQFFEAPARSREPALILTVGYVDRLKGHDVLLRAMALLRRRQIQTRAVIAGPLNDSEFFNILGQFVRKEKLDVEFTGFIPPEAVLSLLHQCSLLVHPSRQETFGMVVGEAMATGTPVIASRVGSLPHLVRDGETGLLFGLANASELADKIQFLLENEPVRSRLADAARKDAVEKFHPDRVAHLTRAAYEQILGGTAQR